MSEQNQAIENYLRNQETLFNEGSDSQSLSRLVQDALTSARESLKSPALEKAGTELGIDLLDVLSNSAVVSLANYRLFSLLKHLMKEKSGGSQLSQVDSYKLVDIWGRNLASRALLIDCYQMVSAGLNQGKDSTRSALQVLLEDLSNDFDSLIVELSKRQSFSSFSGVADVLRGLLTSDSHRPLTSAIAECINGMRV
jgi:hypothetical protein